MKPLLLCLLVVLTTCSSANASHRPINTSSSFASRLNTQATTLVPPIPQFQFRKQVVFTSLFSVFKKRLVPDGDPKRYRYADGGLSVASFVCGIAGIFVPVLGPLLGIAAIVLGIIALSKGANYRGLAITGMALGILGLLIFISLLLAFFRFK